MLLLLLAGTQAIAPPYQEQACRAVEGSCTLESECEGEVLHGYCPSQPAGVKCCRRAWQCSSENRMFVW